jgi:hypothetical protein
MRRAAHEALNVIASTRYHDMQEEEACRLAVAISSTPDRYYELYQAFAASHALSITYDRPVRGESGDAKLLETIHNIAHTLEAAAAPGAHPVELFPWMMNIPNR